ncbi:glycoside hydrolase family 3 N-terminal domain-containing protein [Henriciella litoralis]|uniref:glycoside hydrolase family 3 N-terminal domain-containing protein n=1 Tax=Henriciella litoralis TaxID=568102 RepID=UPI000A010129|nr:glycoside hydrolase family 3 N-terminal domain-containing protein [Henriciella litoralis]
MTNKACILSISGPDLLESEAALFAEYKPWGVILMGRSCISKDQIRKCVDDIWTAVGREILIFIDQEGGRVARLKSPEWPIFPRGEVYGQLYDRDPELGLESIWLGHRLIAHELASMGIHADCAPICDLPQPGAHDVIGDRAYGTDPDKVGLLARAALRGLEDGNVAGVIKHIPGHGRSMADSHLELPRVTAGDNELASDFAAFVHVNDAAMAMTAHISYDAFDAERAATVSPLMIQEVIRRRIGFDGLLMTDDLGMKALGGTLTDRADASIAAGCDVLLHCSGFLKNADDILAEMTEVAEAAPVLDGKSLARAEAAERSAQRGQDFDVDAGWTRFRELVPNVGAMHF